MIAGLVLGLVLAPAALKAATPVAPPFWSGKPDAAAFEEIQKGRIARARQGIEKLTAVKGKHTIENSLTVYDAILTELNLAGSQSNLVENTNPDSALRATAEKMSREVSALSTEISLNKGVYDALAGMDVSKADPATRFYVERTLRDFRLAGVDRDEATRNRVTALRKEIVETGQLFAKNIRNGMRTVTVAGAADLDGLPADFIANHKPGPDGKITLTTEYPDAYPVLDYANKSDVRREMFYAFQNRAYPENMAALDSLIAKRHRLATLLGFPNWADFTTADKMVGSGKNASDFIDKIVEMSRPIGDREYQELLREKRKTDPAAAEVFLWESSYWQKKVRAASYDFDAQSVRPYFAYDKVKQGVLDVTGRLFGVTFRRVDTPVWHASVECYEMVENGEVRGRFYLDMHPRKNKYTHAAHFNIRTGIAGKQIPEAALLCNFAGGEPNDPGLMEHSQVETFFHEFGHLVHNMFAGGQQWVGIGGIRTERDFAEAPSQMLEEWVWDPTVLASFAKHYQTGEPIPVELVQRMRRADEFGKGLANLRQMTLARLSLSVYDRNPSQVNTDAMVADFTSKYQPFKPLEGTHFQAAFGHLDGYSAVYYTYMWSLVIAKDMFSKFNRNDLLEPKMAKRYRDMILAPGGSKPAGKLVEDFLGRPFNMDAYKAWLNEPM